MHEVQRAYSVMKTVVNRPGIDEVTQPELADSTQPLYPRVVQDLCEISVAQLDKPVDRVIEQLRSCSHTRNLVSFFALAPPSQNNCEQRPLNHL